MKSDIMVPMFADEWNERMKRARRHWGVPRVRTLKSLVYQNPESGAQMRTCPDVYTEREWQELVRECRKAGYTPCYADRVTIHV
jgi:hypothetical protein